ncbi:MAG: ATP-grasp domain-containing protein [Bacillota bacterium]|nr:ATP-grasp domain-containing protein [Bacillota bacterium]
MVQAKFNRIVIIGGTPEIYECAKKLDIEILSIQKLESFNKDMARLSLKTFVFEYENLLETTKFIQAVSKLYPIDCVLTFTEDAQELAATINETMGLPGIPSSLANLVKDKSMMRDIILDFSPVNFSLVNTVDELKEFIKKSGYPVILKPKDGVGSNGVKLIQKEEEIRGIDFTNEMLAEEFLVGKEYSVESFSFDGNHKVFSVTEKHLFSENEGSRFVEQAHKVPANLTELDRELIIDYVNGFLTSVNLMNGPAHTEIILTNEGPRVIETHTRPGGDYIPDLVNLSYGVNLYEMTFNWFVKGRKAEINTLENYKGSAIKFLSFKPGKVKKVVGLAKASTLKGVIRIGLAVKEGEYINTVTKSRDRSGYIIAIGKDSNEAYAICEKASALLEIIYEQEKGDYNAGKV